MNKSSRVRTSLAGFTLMELIVCLVIVAITGAIIYVAFAPAREKARETRCLSNLRQIGAAIRMYRDDYYGEEAVTGSPMTIAQLGLPPLGMPFRMMKYLPSMEVWFCLSYFDPTKATGSGDSKPMSHYPNHMLVEEDAERPERVFSNQVKARGEDAVILSDPFHGNRVRPVKTPNKADSDKVLLLRLSGQVESKMIPRGLDSTKW